MRRDEQRLSDILEALDWIANAIGPELKARYGSVPWHDSGPISQDVERFVVANARSVCLAVPVATARKPQTL